MRRSYIQPMINWDWYLVCDEKDGGVEVISFDRHHRYEDRGCKVPFRIDGTLSVVSEGPDRTLVGITVNEGGGFRTLRVLNPGHVFSYHGQT